jgi:AAA domain
MTVLQYRPGVRGDTLAMVFFAGPSGSGKSLSALKFARGLADGDDSAIAAIDTENGRLAHYFPAEGEPTDDRHFQPQYLQLEPPFTPDNYRAAIEAAAKLKPKPKVILIDSASHENDAVNEHHDRELTRMAGNDYDKREKAKFAAWVQPKQLHGRLLNCILQQRCHFVITLRAKDAIKPVKNSKGKVEFLPVGWTPIAVSGLEYEATALLVFPPSSQGVPDLGAERTKLQGQHAHIFPVGFAITEGAGRAMALWCKGQKQKPAASPPSEPRQPASPLVVPQRPADEPAGGEPPPPPAGLSPMEEARARGVDEGSQAAYNNLHESLRHTRDPRAWWKDHTRALQVLEEAAPMLYQDLVRLGGLLKKKEATS